MTLVRPTRTGEVQHATTRPVMVQDLTGLPEDVLHAVGYARRVGALISYEQLAEHDNGHITVRVTHTLVVPLRVTGHLAPVDMRNTRDLIDYLEIAWKLIAVAIGATALYGVWRIVTWIAQAFGVVGHTVSTYGGTAVLIVACLGFLALFGGGGKVARCVGIHCGGCRG